MTLLFGLEVLRHPNCFESAEDARYSGRTKQCYWLNDISCGSNKMIMAGGEDECLFISVYISHVKVFVNRLRQSR